MLSVRELVLDTLADFPAGLTDAEGAQHASAERPVDTVAFARRRHDLVVEGLVMDTGRKRSSSAGRKVAIVWALNPATTNATTEDVA